MMITVINTLIWFKTTATGTQADSTTYASVSTGTGVEIGMESTGRQFAGGIAIFRVYNTALTDDSSNSKL